MSSAKYIITAQDKTKAGIQSARQNLSALEKGINTASSTGAKGMLSLGKSIMSKAGPIVAIGLLSKKTSDFAKESRKVWLENEQIVLRYGKALSSNNIDIHNMNKIVSELATKTTTSTTEIQGLVSRLISLGRTEQQTQRILQAGIAISNATGENLNSVINQLNQSFSGTTSRLQRELLPELKNYTNEQLRNGEAVDLALEKYKDYTDLLDGSSTQSVKRFNDEMNRLHQEIGKSISSVLNPFNDWLSSLISMLADRAEKGNTERDREKEGYLFRENNKSEVENIERLLRNNPVEIMQMLNNVNTSQDAKHLYDVFDSIIVDLMNQLEVLYNESLNGFTPEIESKERKIRSQINQLEGLQRGATERRNTLHNRNQTNNNVQQEQRAQTNFLEEIQKLHKKELEYQSLLTDLNQQQVSGFEKEIQILENGFKGFSGVSDNQIKELAEMAYEQNNKEAEQLLRSIIKSRTEEPNDVFTSFLNEMEELKNISLKQNSILQEMGKDEVDNEVIRRWANSGLGLQEVNISTNDIQKLLNSNDEQAQRIGQYFLERQYNTENKTQNKEPSSLQMFAQSINQSVIPSIEGMTLKFLDMLMSVDGVSETLEWFTTILTGVFDVISPLISQVLQPLVGILKTFGHMIGEVLTPLFLMLDAILLPIINLFVMLFNVVLNPLFEILKEMLNVLLPLFEIIGVLLSLLQILTPIFQLLTLALQPVLFGLNILSTALSYVADGFEWFYNKVIVPIGNGLLKVWTTIANAVISVIRGVIGAINRIPGVNISRPSTINFDDIKLKEIGKENNNKDAFYTAGGYANPYSSGSGGTTAQYTGSKDLTVNVSITTGVITGDNGFDELAIRLRDTIYRVEQLGL